MRRHLPRWSQLQPLLRRRSRTGSRLQRRLRGAADLADLRRLARRRTPRPVFDYVDGGAGDELSLRRSVEAFQRTELRPRVLRDVSTISTVTTILGVPSALPFVFAPTGFTRMMHAEGEPAVARVAARAGIPYALSTMGTTTPEDLAVASGDGRRWFQLYVWRDRDRSLELLHRAEAAGFDVLVLTVDVPVPGARLRDDRNGFTVPPALTWRTFANGAIHPRWLLDFLTTDPPAFATLESDGPLPLEVLAGKLFDPTVRIDDLAWFRQVWHGPIVVKGVQSVDDAVLLADRGIDGIVVSNHGGRQLDRAVTPLELLPAVVAAVGDRTEVLVDGGVRNGGDVAIAMALGARGVLVGRAYLYGLMAGGEAGVQRATDILTAELRRTMALLGATSIGELTPELVRLRPAYR